MLYVLLSIFRVPCVTPFRSLWSLGRNLLVRVLVVEDPYCGCFSDLMSTTNDIWYTFFT